MPEFMAKMSLNKDKVTLDLPDELTLTALELEEFMRNLAVLRANMLPPQPSEDLAPGTPISAVQCKRWYVGLDHNAPTLIRLYLQHLGFGWVWLPLTASGAHELARAIRRIVQNRPMLS